MNFVSIKNPEWNDDIEKLLKTKQLSCIRHVWLHNYDTDRYYHFHNNLFIANVVIVSMSAASVIASNSIFSKFDNVIFNYTNIAFGIVNIISVGISTFQQKTNYSDLSSQHKIASAKYNSLANNMLKLLAMDKATKQTSFEFFTWADTEFTNLQINSPNPSSKSVKEYKKQNSNLDCFESINLEAVVTDIQKEQITPEDVNPINKRETAQKTLHDFRMKRWIDNA